MRRDLARATSTLGAPASIAAALLVGVACSSAKTQPEGLALGGMLAVCATVPTTLYLRRTMSTSSDRLAALAIGCASVLLPLLLLRALDAPRDLRTVLETMLVVLAFSLIATPLSRISIHMAASTGAMVILQLLFGTIGVALLPVAALIGWSRLELGEHTPAQVVAGAVIGALGACVAYAVGQ